MTTCAECLSAISTMRVADIQPGSPVAEHCATCVMCASVAQETAFAERRLSDALSEARPSMTPEYVSHGAIVAAERLRRKEVGRWVSGLLAAAACVTFWFFMQDVFIPRVDPAKKVEIETISLNCITPEQAMGIATPYLRSHGSAIYTVNGLHAVTIRGQSDEFAMAMVKIKALDDAAHCAVPAPATPAPTTPAPTSTGTPGKD